MQKALNDLRHKFSIQMQQSHLDPDERGTYSFAYVSWLEGIAIQNLEPKKYHTEHKLIVETKREDFEAKCDALSIQGYWSASPVTLDSHGKLMMLMCRTSELNMSQPQHNTRSVFKGPSAGDNYE